MGPCLGKTSNGPDKLLADMRKAKTPIVWVLGGPGSGKGTQCKMLVERYNFVHVCSGDLLREEVTAQTDIGMVIQEVMAKGELVPRDIVLEILKNAMLDRLPGAKGFLVNGYPREVQQAEDFEDQIGSPAIILYLDVTDDTMMDKSEKRAEALNRYDDTPEMIRNRIDIFHQISEPVFKQYSDKVVKINGEASMEEIFQKCCDAMSKIASPAQSASPPPPPPPPPADPPAN